MTDKENIETLKKSIVANLEDSKANDIIIIPLEGKSDICDYMVIASGNSDRHTISIAEKLMQFLKHEAKAPYDAEGLDDGKWVLVDSHSIVTHIFHPETREYYNLETLWADPKSRKIK